MIKFSKKYLGTFLLLVILVFTFSGCKLFQPTIHNAAQDGDLETMRELLKAGTDINATDDAGGTPLHRAAASGHYEIVEYLLRHKADMHAKTNNDMTPMRIAKYNNQTEIVELLRTYGATD